MNSVLEKLKENWKSGVTVSLVSLPLSVSLAVAANATPLMGVITAFWAGLIAAFFGGSHYNIVGPTGALSGILATYAILYGVGVLPLLAILSGIIILLFYVFRLDKYIIFIPSSVIHGFTLGVAFIIGLNQLNFALGLTGLETHSHFFENVIESFKHIANTNGVALSIFLVSLTILILFSRYLKRVPGAIVVALLGIILGMATTRGFLPFELQTLATKFGDLKGSLISIPHFSFSFVNFSLVKASFAIALVAILETLISAKIADGMTKTRFNQRKEVFGLGLANVFSGIFGGIPATAALARTALNIKSGSTHRTSGIINAVLVGVIAVFFLSTFKFLPLPIVAAILVFVAIRMVETGHFIHLYKHDKMAFYLSFFVALVTIVEDPIIGILIGSTASLLFFVNQLSKAQAEITVNKNKKVVSRVIGSKIEKLERIKGDILVYRIAGQMTYVNSQSHLEMVRQLKQAKIIILSLRNLFYIDVDGLDAMSEIIDEIQRSGKEVYISGVGEFISLQLQKTPWFKLLSKNKKVFESTGEALETLGYKKVRA